MTTETKPIPAILIAQHAIMSELVEVGIGKNRDNTQQRFMYRGIDDLYNAVTPLLAKHRVVMKATGDGDGEVREGSSKGGGALYFATVPMIYRLTSLADESWVEARFVGEAMDSADKARNKAMSAAQKYFFLQTFCIPTEGDDKDADHTTHAPEPGSFRGQQSQRPPDDRPLSNTEMNDAMQARRLRRAEAAMAIGSAQNCAKLDRVFAIAHEDIKADPPRIGDADMIEIERMIVERYVDLSESETDLTEAERLIHEAGKRNVIRWQTAEALGTRIADKRAKFAAADEAPL